MSIRDILEAYRRGEMSEERAESLLKLDFLQRIGDHTLFDHAREARRGIPEIVFGESKDPGVLADIVESVMENHEVLLVSRATDDHYRVLKERIGEEGIRYSDRAEMIILDRRDEVRRSGKVGILAAGTSDVRVAEEAREVAECMGCGTICSYDVGVAAPHRLIEPLHRIVEEGCDVLVVVAGMEGALPSVGSGLVDLPVIGVPSSVGYGLGGQGEAALMSMLQSCSPGLVVVNIDNGVNAGATAALISRRCRP